MALQHNARAMLLVVDVGNTQTHFGVFRGSASWSSTGASPPCASRPADELGAALRQPARRCAGSASRDLDASIVSSTVPQLCRAVDARWPRATSATRCCVVGPAIEDRHADPDRQPARARRRPPRQRGRGVRPRAAAPASSSTSAPRSPTTPCRPPGEYLGGIISPGAEISIDALYERAAKLPKVELAEPRSLIGKSTVDAIRCGIVYGFAGQVDGIVRRLRDELGSDTDGDRHRRPRRRARALRPRDDRRGRRPADADRAAADLGAQPAPGWTRGDWTLRRRGPARRACCAAVTARIRKRERGGGCPARPRSSSS